MKDINVSNFWFVEPGGASGIAGELALICKSNLKVEVIDFSLNHINVIVSPTNNPPSYYGSPYAFTKKAESWKMIENTTSTNQFPWLIMGDFNFILHNLEKFGTHPIDTSEANFELDMVDLGFTGRPFTWSKKRDRPPLIEQRLDRGISTDDWILLYPNTTISNMLDIGSDHHLILLSSNPHWKNGSIPFKFFGPWLEHEDCKKIIAGCWNKTISGSSAYLNAKNLKDIKLQIRFWNKDIYGNIKIHVEELKQ
ncbi:uncharacterized protein LOC113313071 [Papaver somniferum]|uniref:uncharacterized protein LOC113313071 n=1 Tax=Papaver somniferum TaxID=3469 RepID=UPI000E6F9DC6|nr:uncharacterized protein LOC113313071 [Papaver somniferum]